MLQSKMILFLRFVFSLLDVPIAFNVKARPSGCYAALLWKTPTDNNCPITRYTVHFRECITSTNHKKNWQTESLTVTNMTGYRLQLNCSKNYEILVIAWNERGSSYADGKSVFVFTEKGENIKKYMEIFFYCYC